MKQMKLAIAQTLLIDDDRSTNFFNKIIVEKHGSFERVSIANSGMAALEYFEAVGGNREIKPNLIFLDINMPGMNGWEFLREFAKLGNNIIDGVNIFMLSTSNDEKEIERSRRHELVKGFFNKPLSRNVLDDIVKRYFCITT